MTKEELLKLLDEAPELTLIEIPFAKLDRPAREFLWFNDPAQDFPQRMKQENSDSGLLKNGIDYLGVQITIVLMKRGVDPKKIKGSFWNRVQLAKKLSPPLEPAALIPRLEALNELYVTHDSTLVDFSQEDWKHLVEKLMPGLPGGLRNRVHTAMHVSAINLDQLGGNTR